MTRASVYSEDVASELCSRLADGRSIRSICDDADMPSRQTVFRWLADPRYASFKEMYIRAREAQADALFDEILDIVDDSKNDWMMRNDPENPGWRENGEAIQRARLRMDARKWMAGKLRPLKYGEKMTFAGDADNPIQIAAVEWRVKDVGN